MTTGQTNTSNHKVEPRPSTSSEVSQSHIQIRPYNNDPIRSSRESLKSKRASQEKPTNNISNEIQDLLSKLVTYHGSGNNQVDTKFSQHSNSIHNTIGEEKQS